MTMMRALLATAAFLFSSLSYAQQVGVVENGIYYSVNPRLPAGTPVQVLPDDDKGIIQCCGEITGPAKKPDRQVSDNLHDRNVTAYALKLSGLLSTETSGFGIAGNVHMLRQGEHPQATLDDGLRVNFSICTSMEGTHYLGRRVGDNKLLVHLYEYFDGDLVPTCQDTDLK
jgi:hypothetical protein